LDADGQPLQQASIGDPLFMVVSSEQAGPHNMVKRDFFEKFLKISKKISKLFFSGTRRSPS